MTFTNGAKLAIVLTFAPLAVACSGSQTGPDNPNAPALERRSTDIVHEDCDVGSGKGIDANGDGRPDIVKVMDGAKETCRAVDINMDSVIDVFIYYDDAGQTRRRESGFDRDTRPDEVAIYKGGQLVLKERETNNDAKIDTWSHFEGGRLVREERDSTGDGYIDQWWQFNRPDKPNCAVVVTDGDGDGKPDKDSEVDMCKDDTPKPGVPAPAPAPQTPEEPPTETPPAETSEAAPEAPAEGAADAEKKEEP